MKMRLTVMLLPIAVGACGAEPVTVTLSEIDDRIARFEVANESPDDVESISIEVTFRSEDASVVRVDTVTYEHVSDPSTCDIIPFVRSGEQTVFAWRVPSGAVSVPSSCTWCWWASWRTKPRCGSGCRNAKRSAAHYRRPVAGPPPGYRAGGGPAPHPGSGA